MHSFCKTLLVFAPLHFCTPKPYLPVTSYFCISAPYREKDIFFDVSSRRFCRSSENHSNSASLALVVGAYTWITMILNNLLWNQTEILLSFLRLHPSIAFQTLFLTMKAFPFLKRDSVRSRYNSHLNCIHSFCSILVH